MNNLNLSETELKQLVKEVILSCLLENNNAFFFASLYFFDKKKLSFTKDNHVIVLCNDNSIYVSEDGNMLWKTNFSLNALIKDVIEENTALLQSL